MRGALKCQLKTKRYITATAINRRRIVNISQFQTITTLQLAKWQTRGLILKLEIDRLIWYLLQTNQALGACVTAQMISIHPRLTALGSLVRLWQVSQPLLDELASLDGTARGLSETRNQIIHDKRMIWWKTKEVVRFQVTAKRS